MAAGSDAWFLWELRTGQAGSPDARTEQSLHIFPTETREDPENGTAYTSGQNKCCSWLKSTYICIGRAQLAAPLAALWVSGSAGCVLGVPSGSWLWDLGQEIQMQGVGGRCSMQLMLHLLFLQLFSLPVCFVVLMTVVIAIGIHFGQLVVDYGNGTRPPVLLKHPGADCSSISYNKRCPATFHHST